MNPGIVSRPILAFLIISIIALQWQQADCQQQEVKPTKGYSQNVGNMVWMMEDLKRRVTNSVQNISEEQTDFLLDEQANRVGAIVLHLAAIEKYYQIQSLGGSPNTSEERRLLDLATDLGTAAREELVGKPISFYLEMWDDVRDETLKLLKKKDDKWFASKVNGTRMNHHWVWYHVMEHQANHMGQIRLILKRAE